MKPLGLLAEDFACGLLKKSGYKIIQRNFHSKFGELDIIALQDDTLVFIEVKARSGNKFGLPEEAVTYWKLQKILKTAEYFCLIHKKLPVKQRVEVIALEFENERVVSSKIIPLM